MTTIGQGASSAAEIRAAALEASSHERKSNAADRYAVSLVDSFQRATDSGSVTISNTKDGTTINGMSIADWTARNLGKTGSQRVTTVQQQPIDVVTLSHQAAATLTREQIALAVMQKTDAHSTKDTTAKATTSPVPAKPASPTPAVDPAIIADGTPEAAARFAATYAAEAADGPAGRFYNSITPESLANTMTDEQYASFKTAFDNKTLQIQLAVDAPGVTYTGHYDTTFSSNGFGKGMSGSGDADVNTVELAKTNQYVLVMPDMFFGPTVISWGGPPDAQPQDTASA